MKSDFDLIVHKMDKNLKEIRIYPVGDIHIGSPEFSQELWDTWIKMVKEDEDGYVVIVGDTIDNGLKNSKTNVYRATMSPNQQKQWLAQQLKPIKHKILGAVRGNHEDRSVKESDDCPLYDVMCKLDIEDLYREKMAIIKVNVGSRTKDRQCSYIIALHHGGSVNRMKSWTASIDGVDVFISGHDHQTKDGYPAKIVVDTKNEVIRRVPVVNVVVPSFAEYGGYAIGGLYTPQSTVFPRLYLNGTFKEIELRRKVQWT
jgi:predicted MPP superfamily phosphohydrolase